MNALEPNESFQITCDILKDQNYNNTTACDVAKLIPIFLQAFTQVQNKH
jgi:hypothetical protein